MKRTRREALVANDNTNGNQTMRRLGIGVILSCCSLAAAAGDLAPGVRGVATGALGKVVMDGKLDEFENAFCTPVCYAEADWKNRAAQFFYLWDDEAFYAALRTLDTKPANLAPDNRLWEGDGVEWYFDTRRGSDFRSKDWGPGAVHMYWTGYKGTKISPRWCLRPDMLKVIPGDGVEVAARATPFGGEVEFKLPWKNFPNFKAAKDAVIALDSELCYSDGGPRVYRTFAFGSPLSVQQPASQGTIQLVEKLEPAHFKKVGPVAFPIRVDTEWVQKERGHQTALMAIPPAQKELVGGIAFRLLTTELATITDIPATIAPLRADAGFYAARAKWPIDVAEPGGYLVMAIVTDKSGAELCRVAPRLVSVNWTTGY